MLYVPGNAGFILFLADRLFGVMGKGVHSALDARKEREVFVGLGIGCHERADPGGIAPECQNHDVHHEFHVLRTGSGNSRTGTFQGEFALIDPPLLRFQRCLEALFHGTDGFEVLVQANAIPGTAFTTEPFCLVPHEVEHTGFISLKGSEQRRDHPGSGWKLPGLCWSGINGQTQAGE